MQVRHTLFLVVNDSQDFHLNMEMLLFLSILAITSFSVLGVLLPLRLKSVGKWSDTMIELLTFLTGGVFLGAGMVHMLPEAVEEVAILDLPPLVSPFVMFCLGYLLVYAIEQTQPGRHVVPREKVLAVAQRTREFRQTASICVVDVPPATTYLDGLRHLQQSLLSFDECQEVDEQERFAHHSHSASPLTRPEDGTSSVHEHTHTHSSLPPSIIGGLPPPIIRTKSAEGWSRDKSGRGCGCADHTHVHSGVMHKSVEVGLGASTMPIVLAILFSVHSFIAGLALGIQSQFGSSAVAILIAILAHKFVEALSLASSFVKEGVATSTSLPVLVVYCTMTPAGVLTGAYILGSALGPSAAAIEALVSGFAAGSFVFLAGHELSHSSSDAAIGKLQRAMLALLGFSSMALLSLWI